MFKLKSYHYQPICIAILIVGVINALLILNLCLSNNSSNIRTETPSENSGLSNSVFHYSQYDDEMAETSKDYQLELLGNGDIVVYQHNRTVGVIKFHKNCDLQQILMADND